MPSALVASAATPAGFPDFDDACTVLDTTVPTGVVNSNDQLGIDNNLNTYVGGHLTIGAAASEIEGLNVVAGDMTVNKDGWFGVGVVGAGSLISPGAGKDVLLVGGNLMGKPSVDTGQRLAQIGGTVTGGFPGWASMYYTDGMGADALITNNYDPAYDFNNFTPRIQTLADNLAQSGTLGSTTVSGGTITLDAQNQVGQIRFDVPAAALAGMTEIQLVNIASTQPLVINLTGTSSATSLTIGSLAFEVTYNDVPGDHVATSGVLPGTPTTTFPWLLNDFGFAGYASRVMWNFNDTGKVALTSGNQWVGSILAPSADLTATQSINGRVYVGGDFTFNGQGNEVHAFAWTGCGLPTALAQGTFQINKVVDGSAASSVPGTTAFTVNYTVNGVAATTPLTVLADGTVVNGPVLEEGDVVVFTEATPPTIAGIDWGTPLITVNGTETNTLTITDGGNATIIVTNTATTTPAKTGTFQINKVVDGSAASSVPGTTAFTVNYTVNGVAATTPLTVLADGTVVNGPVLEEGDVVVFTEATPPTIAGIDWGTPLITVNGTETNTLTITDGGNATIIVTNTATTTPGTGAPSTGTPGTGEPSTGTPGTGEPSTGTPGTDEPSTGTPGTDEPTNGATTDDDGGVGSEEGEPTDGTPTDDGTSPDDGLPVTGAQAAIGSGIALLLIVGGTALLAVRRREA
ncbi:choice-of-anchor A family protein [Flavimobilis sp. GY10621]|uniref:Choice-of-anchor A family protein n=1 Tax=Flavimobilis rhizosphaerae TaxID=2775421 RepID=A0ABR9DRX0_9MICO|nr:choice-of-anchor A family protein [Flavimobilis rhizosphaerae]MBD9699877.1 choice-of-anchor A family protein [Flavimobilis rhizosphaerae]